MRKEHSIHAARTYIDHSVSDHELGVVDSSKRDLHLLRCGGNSEDLLRKEQRGSAALTVFARQFWFRPRTGGAVPRPGCSAAAACRAPAGTAGRGTWAPASAPSSWPAAWPARPGCTPRRAELSRWRARTFGIRTPSWDYSTNSLNSSYIDRATRPSGSVNIRQVQRVSSSCGRTLRSQFFLFWPLGALHFHFRPTWPALWTATAGGSPWQRCKQTPVRRGWRTGWRRDRRSGRVPRSGEGRSSAQTDRKKKKKKLYFPQ